MSQYNSSVLLLSVANILRLVCLLFGFQEIIIRYGIIYLQSNFSAITLYIGYEFFGATFRIQCQSQSNEQEKRNKCSPLCVFVCAVYRVRCLHTTTKIQPLGWSIWHGVMTTKTTTASTKWILEMAAKVFYQNKNELNRIIKIHDQNVGVSLIREANSTFYSMLCI